MTVAQFAAIPFEVAKCGDPFALAVWTAIRQYHQINVTGGKWIHNMVFYAKELQMSVETVRRKIHFLIKKGFLKREKRNHYQFGYNYEIPEEWLCLTEEQLKEYRKHKKVKVKMSKESSKKSEAEKPKNFAQNLDTCEIETDDFRTGHIKQNLIKKEFIKEEREILEDEHTFNINEFQIQEDSKPEIVVEKPILRSEIQTNNKNLNEDKPSERVVRDKRLGLPVGEWLDEETGDFKEGFLQWRADWALKTFPDIETPLSARQWARKNFFNHPEELPLHWFNYKETFETKMENVKVRIDNGLQIRQEEKETFGRMGVELGAFTPSPEVISPSTEVESTALEIQKPQLIVEDTQGLNPVEYLRKMIADYKAVPVWEREEKVNWKGMNWEYALGTNYSRWMQLVRGASEGDFANDETLGHDYGVRTVFYRWYKATTQDYSTEDSNSIPVNAVALNMLERFKEIFNPNKTKQED